MILEKKPLKRVKELQELSREHHHGLLLCWKIRAGFSKNIAPERIKKYADWFYTEHLLPHFELEEEYVFPVLKEGHELVKKALIEHRRLRRLFSQKDHADKNLGLIEEELEAHIRFEERVLFPEIQKVATAEQLAKIAEVHKEGSFTENEQDVFWK
ncbi:hemerythrin domain-containing protein [Flavobacterium suncheonense]|uniref:Cation-binding protein n=1 Tax=Flavobacterium suncheonense GH29-5 = DSM 17707 TaxID=1121899 RepID=A0A0A2MDA6_9FLAO|nr:hemerythrin domain-containing protein [Flavobacterium suncheonense]KGO89591.1 cation-binding protein [Flavobacterium suncheonense GH29-5 = DSM 17707]